MAESVVNTLITSTRKISSMTFSEVNQCCPNIICNTMSKKNEDFLHFFVFYDSRLNIFGFRIVFWGRIKNFFNFFFLLK